MSVEGSIRTSRTPPENAVQLVNHRGDSLGRQLAAMMRYSNNYMADILLLNLHAEAGGQVPFSVDRAALDLQDYARRIAAADNDPLPQAPDSLLLRDGSGLDPDNRLSASALTSLLHYLYEERPDVFPAFLNSLSVPAYSSGSSLRNQDSDWLYRISGKTGGLSEPVSVTTLAGYLRFKDGGGGLCLPREWCPRPAASKTSGVRGHAAGSLPLLAGRATLAPEGERYCRFGICKKAGNHRSIGQPRVTGFDV
ncbi:D-alanyl-D-alanine carboxypeptidase [Fodinicurvata halophila]|uniref:D-alanyl-D-alanine carboxypeptidase n=1 Tax=Fodinicurvata halophila TaxID=1419723 RepID=UPI0036259698